jgi:hypothetical protein|tara:strand:+ start:1637 stop:1789 length:153 start_codon:yes stop_codon:yes gene_type:complete
LGLGYGKGNGAEGDGRTQKGGGHDDRAASGVERGKRERVEKAAIGLWIKG